MIFALDSIETGLKATVETTESHSSQLPTQSPIWSALAEDNENFMGLAHDPSLSKGTD